MTLIINDSDWDDLSEDAPAPCPKNLVLDDFEEITGVPAVLGQGYLREMDLLPGVCLGFSEFESYQDLVIKAPIHDHQIQISIFPTGLLYFDEVHLDLGRGRSYFSGSGVSPAVTGMHRARERLTCVNIEIDPELFHSVFLTEQQRDNDALKQLFKGQDWKVAFYPTVTPAIQTIAQQMWDAPYRGALKQVYLQAKVMELLVIYLDMIAESQKSIRVSGLKPDTIARLYHAKEILDSCWENPPLMLELAQQIGVSHSSLLRGFKQLFGTTAIGYLTQQRLKRAEQLLQQGDCTVTQVAERVGYGHLGHFTAVFKRQFGITPSQCLAGKKTIL
ncbi:MAG: AraC family transcriptional regulator [Aphanocapsa sp. GSE-SYN-MK-11-07L]|jgi:AraC-like DNA-binding protein|nr:AraC family transcriptional regulator [Aphanocapsa sp. GSE-SYN-MK-11-07L]